MNSNYQRQQIEKTMDFQAIRKEYEDLGIEIGQLDRCPLKELSKWIDDAAAKSPEPWFEANAMALATADSAGNVSVRYVLLKGILDDGIQFFTNYQSAKGRQLAANPNCSAVLHWPYLGRQVRISGQAEKTPRSVSEDYFHSRPRAAQISATVSQQSAQLSSRSELEAKTKDYTDQMQGQELPLPEQWGGYLIRPVEVEFWQGRSNRLHDRIVYQLDAENSWQTSLLSP